MAVHVLLDSFNNNVYKMVVLPTPLGPTIMQLIFCCLANILPMATTKREGKGGEGGREAGAGGEAKVRQWWGKAFGGCFMLAGNRRRAFWKNKKCRKIWGRTSVVVNVDGRCGVREMGRSGARVGHDDSSNGQV